MNEANFVFTRLRNYTSTNAGSLPKTVFLPAHPQNSAPNPSTFLLSRWGYIPETAAAFRLRNTLVGKGKTVRVHIFSVMKKFYAYSTGKRTRQRVRYQM